MGTPRRRVLELAGLGLGGLAGCNSLGTTDSDPDDTTATTAPTDTATETNRPTSTATPTPTPEAPPPLDPATSYPQFQYDAGNSGRNRAATMPTGEVTATQRFDPLPAFAIIGDVVYTNTGAVYTLPEKRMRWYAEAPNTRTVPAIDGDSMYLAGQTNEGFEYAIAAVSRTDRSVRWQQPLQDLVRSHTTVVDDTVFTADFSGTAYAFATADGQERWRLDIGERAMATIASDGELAVVGGFDGLVRGIDVTSGQERWRAESNYDFFGTTLVDGTAFATATTDVLAIDAASGDGLWQTELPTSILTSVAVGDELVYVAGRNGTLYALDRASGDQRWHYDVADRNDSASPVVADEAVVVGSKSGTVAAVDAVSGAERWTVELPRERRTSTPAVVDGSVYVACGPLYEIHETNS